MLMRSIQTKLLVSFFAVIAILLALSVFFVVMHFTLIKQYHDITNIMIDEYRITDVSTNLVSLFIPFAKSVNDKTLQDRYDGLRKEITDIFSRLDAAIVNKASRVAYIGLKNNVNTLVGGLDAGIAAVKRGDIQVVGSTYDTALGQNYFVTENAGTLILNDLQYTERIQADIARKESWSQALGAGLFAMIAIGVLIYSILFSRRLINPLDKLTKLAGNVTGGKLELAVDRELLEQRDEVGSLANSFDVMIRSLRSTIHELDAEKKGVEEKVVQRTQELQEEHAQLLTSVKSLPLGFILADKDHNLIMKNDSANLALGFPPGDFSMAAAMKALQNFADVKAKAEECMAKGETIVNELEYENKFLKLFFTSIVLPGSKEMIGYAVLLEDITEAKLLERTRDEFFVIASHELRTPLTAIRGNSELIQDFFAEKVKDKEVMSMIADIRDASTRLIALVNDFLDVSRIEQHRVKFNKEPVPLAAVAKEVLKTFTAMAAAKGLAMDLKVPRSLPDAFGDADHIKQIFINLVGNAVNYTKKGSITVAIAPEGSSVKVSITDTGIGISEENKKLLFRKFQQAGKNIYTRDVTRGTGLGLYISKLLVEDMKGTVWLEKSEEGKGSTFSFMLPAAV
jgi:two-component system phosphate regulon sensor histidine kinase PhoR